MTLIEATLLVTFVGCLLWVSFWVSSGRVDLSRVCVTYKKYQTCALCDTGSKFWLKHFLDDGGGIYYLASLCT